jgi:hypothetical protein
MKDDSPFGIGGLWENWKEPASGEWIRTFAIITTDANELVADIHDRMPLILAPSDYARWLSEAGLASSFHPRGVVIGPDGLLYVSNDPILGGNGGHILRFDPATRNFKDIFVSNDVCNCDFNRPEGLVFGPDGNLYVTSFRASLSDTDKILIFAGPASTSPTPGTFLAKIDLDQVGPQRAYAQALLFGPGGRLFVPITTPMGRYSGQVRRYDVSNLDNISFDIFVPSSSMENSPLGSGWYLTFGSTNPATLNYLPTCAAAGSC